MRDRKCSRLLRKRQWKFPDQNDGGIYENRTRAVLKFACEIAADPRIRAQDRPMTFGPTARHVGEHMQHRQFIIIIPKNEWIMPEQDQAKEDGNESGSERANDF